MDKIKDLKNEYKKASFERIGYERYMNLRYISISSRYQLYNILSVKKDVLYVIDEKNIYVYTGELYYWERYRVDHKTERLVKVINENGYKGWYEFSPTNNYYKRLNEKDTSELIDEKSKYILDNKRKKWGVWIMPTIIMIIYLINIILKCVS